MSDPEVFKYRSELAVKDPVRFEKERKEVIEEAFLKAPERNQKHLQELQRRIDATRVDDPLESCERLSQLMRQEVRYLVVMGNDLLWELERLAVAGQNHDHVSDIKSGPTLDGETKIISLLKK